MAICPLNTPFARLGGASGLRLLIDDFVERMVRDPIIGFFFAKVDLKRLKALEYGYAAGHLGGPRAYRGRPLQEAHRAHAISGGHFARRRRLLAEVLDAHAVAQHDARAWIAHQDAQAPLVVRRGPGSACPAD